MYLVTLVTKTISGDFLLSMFVHQQPPIVHISKIITPFTFLKYIYVE